MNLQSIEPAIAVLGGGVLLLLLWWLVRSQRGRSEEPDFLVKVRRHVARGELRRAGELQYRHGNIQEAYNLFDRGAVHDRAADCAEKLGFHERAALHAEKSGQLERAARLYRNVGQPGEAARLFQRVGNFREAAEALELDLSAPPLELGQLWENAFLDLVPAEGEPLAPTQHASLQRAAERAAENFKRAGEMDRAAHFYELCDRPEVAKAIRENLPSRVMDKLDQVRDRLRVRLRAAMETSTTGDYAFAPAVEEEEEQEATGEPFPGGTPAPEAAPTDLGPSLQRTELGLPGREGGVRTTELGLPGRRTGTAEQEAILADPAMAPTTLIDASRLREPMVGVTPVAGLSAANLPPEVEDAEVFPQSADPRSAVDVLGLDNSRPGRSESAYDNVLRDLLDPPGREGIEHLEPTGEFASASGRSVRRAEDEVIALGDHDPYIEPQPYGMRLDPELVSAVAEEVVARQKAQARPTPAAGILTVSRRPSTPREIAATATAGRHAPAAGPTVPQDDVPTVGRLEVVYRSEVPEAPSRDLSVDSDRFQLLEELGSGGMGVVHRARDRVLEREVALKFLPEGMTMHPQMLGLFEREAKAAAQLNHPNIVTVHDFGVLGGKPFICMELVQGSTVAEMIASAGGQGLPVLDVMRLAEGLLAALDYAHGKGVVHRDIKPSNLMRSPLGGVKLMDFGIAGLLEPDKTTRVAGTPAYMAPEQMAGKGIDNRTDLFAVGVTLYEMLTGELPFEGLRRDTPIKPPREYSAAVPKRLDRMIVQCLSLEGEQRPQSALEMLKAVEAMRRQVELYLDQELGPPTDTGSRPSVDMIDAETLRTLLSQLAAPESGDAAEAEPLFRAALADPRPAVRAAAVSSYPEDLDPALRAQVSHLLDDTAEEVRVAVIDRLGASGEHDLVAMLEERAREGQGNRLTSTERRALYNSLIEVGGRDALEHLETLYDVMTAPGLQTIESAEDERHVRAQLKDMMDALGRFDEPRADDLAARVRARQEEIEYLLADAETPAPGRGGITPRSVPRILASKVPSTSVPAAAPMAEAMARRKKRKDLPPEVEALLRDYLKDSVIRGKSD